MTDPLDYHSPATEDPRPPRTPGKWLLLLIIWMLGILIWTGYLAVAAYALLWAL